MNRTTRCLGSLGLLLGFFSVGCGDKQAGEIMMGISTNMSLPKDVSAIRIQVIAHGEHIHDNVYPVGPGDGRQKLPGSLAVIHGEDETMPVTMKVIALQGPERTARIVAKAISTVPVERIAQLNLPVDWLCDETAKSTGDLVDPDYESTCGDGKTCTAGACVENKIDETTLGDYDPGNLFGGGTGDGDGTCFDTQPCFADSTSAAVSLSDCTFDAPAGSLNVAVQTEGDGICGSSGCLVPLDQSDKGAGWSSSGGKVHLPTKVCELLQNGKAVGVSVSTACATKTFATPTCGPWSSVGSAYAPAEGELTVLAAGQEHPVAIAVANGQVYWTTSGLLSSGGGDPVGKLKSTSPSGGTPTTYEAEFSAPRELIALGSELFFTTYGPTAGQNQGAIFGLKEATVTSIVKGLNTPEGLAVSNGTVFFTNFVDGEVLRYNKGATTVIASGQNYPIRITIDSDRVVWLNEGQLGLDDGSVDTIVGQEHLVLAANQPAPRALAVDQKGVCWTTLGTNGENGQGAVQCLPFEGGSPTGEFPVKADGQSFPVGIAMNDDTVYWTNRGDGTVRKMPRAGGTPIQGAKNQYKPGSLTLNAGVLYWVNEGDPDHPTGSVMSLSTTSSSWAETGQGTDGATGSTDGAGLPDAGAPGDAGGGAAPPP
jgi:hypothetical protein